MPTIAIDDFHGRGPQIDGPGTDFLVPTFDDNNDQIHVSRAILFTAAGNVKLTSIGAAGMQNGVAQGETGVVPVLAGMRLDLQCSRIWATGTTVTAASVIWIW